MACVQLRRAVTPERDARKHSRQAALKSTSSRESVFVTPTHTHKPGGLKIGRCSQLARRFSSSFPFALHLRLRTTHMLVLLDGAVFDVWNGIREEKYHRLVKKDGNTMITRVENECSFRSIVELKTRFSGEWMETEGFKRD